MSTSEPEKGVTKQLCNWLHTIPLTSIPPSILLRAKYLILDGLACALVGSHLPWSETATHALLEFEPPGSCTVIGWGGGGDSNEVSKDNPESSTALKLSPLSATLLNSSFIQGFELDDYHSRAPLHSNSLILPALFSAIESSPAQKLFSGEDFLRAYVLSAEVGPRVGLALHGSDLLTRGWHSGAVQGSPVAAAAASVLLGLSPAQIEWALGMACTQAGGLMSAQFGSMAKRMQHGFAARNGVLGAMLAKGGYTGIEDVFEREYGGYLEVFGQGANFEPKSVPGEIVAGLGERWETGEIRVKLHAAMAALHGPIQGVGELQKENPGRLEGEGLKEIERVKVRMGRAAFEHGGWKADEEEELTSTGAQMSVQYAVSAQLLDGEVMMGQYGKEKLNRREIRELMKKIEPMHDEGFDGDKFKTTFTSAVEVVLKDGTKLVKKLEAARGIKPPASNEEIVEKWKLLVKDVLDDARRDEIEQKVLHLENLKDARELVRLLAANVRCPISA